MSAQITNITGHIAGYRAPCLRPNAQAEDEQLVVERFASRINSLGPLTLAPAWLQARVLEEVRVVARSIDVSAEMGPITGYGRRVLYEEPEQWSLAAIILRPGRHTHPHDHGGWGCAVTVQGVERDCRFTPGDAGELQFTGQRDYPPGWGYVFDVADVHQPVGVAPLEVTVSLHFLVYNSACDNSHREVVDQPHNSLLLAA